MSVDLFGCLVEIKVGYGVKFCDFDKGFVVLVSGEILMVDVIIGVDGIYLVLWMVVVGNDWFVLLIGFFVYWMLVFVELLLGIDVFKEVFDLVLFVIIMVVGVDCCVIMGLGCDGIVFGIVVLVFDSICVGVLKDDFWVVEGSFDSFLEVY